MQWSGKGDMSSGSTMPVEGEKIVQLKVRIMRKKFQSDK